MPSITSANVAQAIVKLVAADALPALVGNLVMGKLVNRNFEATLAQSGDTVNVPIPPLLAANNIAETGSVQTQAASAGNAQIVLNNHVEASFSIPDVVKVLASPDLMTLYMQPAINALAERIETDILNTYSLFTANAAVGAGTSVDEARIDAAETVLFNAKVAMSQPKFLVVNGGTYGAMRQLPRFSEMQTAGNADGVVNGQIAKIKDFVVLRSQFVPAPGGIVQNLAFARDAIGLVMRRLPQPIPGTGAIAEYAEQGNFGVRITMSYQPNTLAQQFTVDVLYGVGALRNNHAVVVKTSNV